jgi:large subunit ribosomal protein L4
MLVDLYTKEGQQAGQIELPDEVFAIEPNEHAIKTDVVNYLAHQRQGTAKTKTRAEVSGGGKKPWRQKGRGTARSGSSRSPVWIGGGTIHGPQPHEYNLKLPRKVKRLARRSALSLRLSENNIIVVDDFKVSEIKTKPITEILKNLKLDGQKTLILMSDNDKNFYLSARNIDRVSIFPVDQLSTYDIMNHKKLLFFKSAIEKVSNDLKNN